MTVRLLPLLALTCLCRADETKRTIGDRVDELSAIYAKHTGYKAIYTFQEKDKSLKVTLGTDGAGNSVMRAEFTEGGQSFEMRGWTEGDKSILGNDRDLIAGSGLAEACAKMESMRKELALRPGKGAGDRMSFRPFFTLTEDSVNSGLAAFPAATPPWQNAALNSTGAETGEKEVVFHTRGSGDITVSRETGMMVKQSVGAEDGGKRELVLSKLELNPGSEAILEVRRGWSAEGAQQEDLLFAIPSYPAILFQEMILQVEAGLATPERLKEMLDAKKDYLRGHQRQFLTPLDEENRKTWEAWVEYGKELAVYKRAKEFGGLSAEQKEAKLSEPGMKAEIRDLLVEKLSEDHPKDAAALAMKGEGTSLTAHTDRGREASRLILEANMRAQTGAEVDRAIAELW